MNLSALFISRPVATTLITFGIALAGSLAFLKLPVSPLPQVDFPTILVQAQLPGAVRRPWHQAWQSRSNVTLARSPMSRK